MARPPPSIGLRSGLDRDLYQVVKKLEEANGGKPFKSVYAAYDAVKRSNSSLSRQKKRPLEDALERVLQVRKKESAGDEEDDDSEAAIDVDEPEPTNRPDERFLLNRQMTKHWNVEPAAMPATNGDQPAKKKRRVEAATEETMTTAVSTPKDAEDKTTDAEGKTTTTQKKTTRPARFEIEQHQQAPGSLRLAGLGETYETLLRDARELLLRPQLYRKFGWLRTDGIVLTGPPGVGKRSVVRALAADLGVALVNVTRCFEEPERMEKSLVEAFDAALAAAPCIVCVEHLEAHMAKAGGASHNEHHQRAASLLQRQMQRIAAAAASAGDGGADVPPPVLAMATAARPADVNLALFGVGMFERTVQLRVPDTEARRDILDVLMDGYSLDADVTVGDLAKMTHGFVGADLTLLIKAAVAIAARRFSIADSPSSIGGLYPTASSPSSAAFNSTYKRFYPSTHPMQPPPDDDDDAASPLPDEFPLTFDDFKSALKDFVPSLRKEGFTVIPNVSWDQVGALSSVREQLHTSIIGPIRNPDLYQGFGLRRPAGCLLWGPPGCGKTLVAQAVAHEAQASFILINGPELLNKYVGESERGVRELFQRARSSTPCILFFDEMDALVPRRDAGGGGGGGSEAGTRVVNALLAELDGVQDRAGIYVIGTTNRPDMMDDAMLRPGRLSVRLFVDLPTPEERVDILAAIYRTCHAEPSAAEMARLPAVARDPRCADFSGADLGGLHTKAAECALKRFLQSGGGETAVKEIGGEDWERALAETTRSVMNPEVYRKLHLKMGKAT